MTITVELVVVVSLGLVGLATAWTVVLVVWCEGAGETRDYRKAPRARTADTKRRVADPSIATSVEKALVSSMNEESR